VCNSLEEPLLTDVCLAHLSQGPTTWSTWRQGALRDKIGCMSLETVTLIGIGVALLSALVLLFRWLRQDLQGLRQHMRDMEGRLNARIDALSSRIDSVNSRIEALYQALFSRKDPAA
jgi:hypothetical protein